MRSMRSANLLAKGSKPHASIPVVFAHSVAVEGRWANWALAAVVIAHVHVVRPIRWNVYIRYGLAMFAREACATDALVIRETGAEADVARRAG